MANIRLLGAAAILTLIVLLISVRGNTTQFIRIGTDPDTGTVFGISQDYPWLVEHEPCLFNMSEKGIQAIVPRSISLLDDSQVIALANKAESLFRERCPLVVQQPLKQKRSFGDHATFGVTVWFSWPDSQSPEAQVRFDINTNGRATLVDVKNWAKRQAQQVAAAEAQRKAEEQRQKQWEADSRAETMRLANERAAKESARQNRWNGFARQYGVQELANESNLFTNPFQYQGKTIAATLRFERMMTANSAVFEGGQGLFVISNIPNGTYKSKRDKRDLIAVTVIGTTELKGIPMVNSMQVPNLKFVGIHFCQDWNCSDIVQQR